MAVAGSDIILAETIKNNTQDKSKTQLIKGKETGKK